MFGEIFIILFVIIIIGLIWEVIKKPSENKAAKIILIIILIFIVSILISCTNIFKEIEKEKNTPLYEIYKSVPISKAEFGDKWTLSVNSGSIDCYKFKEGVCNNGGAVCRGSTLAWYFKNNEKIYAVIGSSQDSARWYGLYDYDIRDIWKQDPKNPQFSELKMDITPIQDKGNEICGYNMILPSRI